MKSRKIIQLTIITLLSTLIILSAIPIGSCAEVVTSSNIDSQKSIANYFAPGLGVGTYYWKQSQTFQASQSGYITKVSLFCYNNPGTNCDVTATAGIWSQTGTMDTDSRPDALYAFGNPLNLKTIGVVDGWLNFTFPAGSCYLTSGVKYAITIHTNGTTYDGGQFKAFIDTASAITGIAGMYKADTGALTYWDAGKDLQFAVYVDSSYSATPAPTATPLPSSYLFWNGTAWVNHIEITPEPNIFDNGVATPYIQMLVPIIILAAASLLGWKFAGAWGFFAGLNIGAILTYMILGSSVFPLWGIVALLVIDGLLLFGKIGIRS